MTDFSRRRFLTKGVALSAAPLVGLAHVEDAVAAPPPTVYDVAAFGAQGDGSTDDTNAIQAAIDSANTRGGGTVVFPAGTFRITRALTIYSQIVFRGAGMRATVIRKSPGGTYPVLKSPGYDPPTGEPAPIFSWSLQNLTLDGNRDAGALGNGVQVYSAGYSLFNVSIANCSGRGFWGEFHVDDPPPGELLEAQLVNVWVHHCTGGGIYWNGPKDSQWVNVVVYLCGPPTGNSTTRGVEVQSHSHGLRVSNGHVWGLNHLIAWYVSCDGPSLVNCTGEGAQRAQLVVVGNDSIVVGGKYFSARADFQNGGIEIGDAAAPSPTAGTFVNTKLINCEQGSLKFVNDAGVGRYTVSIWQMAGKAIVVAPGQRMKPSNRLDVQLAGGAAYGDLGPLKPVTLQEDALARQSLTVQGKVGFYGTPATSQSAGWDVTGIPDARSLNASSDPAQVRAVLATLLRELRRYGLLEAPVPGPAKDADERT
ncbi:MAG TPA: glycoside hydrolase family 55 protein [Gaiellaceae bacterium]